MQSAIQHHGNDIPVTTHFEDIHAGVALTSTIYLVERAPEKFRDECDIGTTVRTE